MTPLREAHAWVDDTNDPKYNQLVELPYPVHTEELWLTDAVYDLLVAVGYNMNPTRPVREEVRFPECTPPSSSDSPREGAGFELSVPRDRVAGFERSILA